MKRLIAFVLALAVITIPARAQQYQQGQPLSALPQATLPLSGNELLYTLQKGQSRQTPVSSVASPNVSFTATGNGATASAPSSQRFGHEVNVIDDFGAPANTATIAGTCSIAAGSFTLTCPSANFAAGTGGCSGDVCKYILIHGAGASGAALQTTISAVVNSTTVTLGNSASTAVPSSALTALTLNAAGSGYRVADTITLAANQGTTTTAAQLQLATIAVSAATPNAAGSGCSNGNYTGLAGTSGRGTFFTFNATVTSGVLSAIAITSGGSYVINPMTNSATPTGELVSGVTGCSGSNAPTVNLAMSPHTWFFTNAGLFSGTLPTSFTQSATSGSGSGATFNTPVLGANGTGTIYGNDDTASVTAAIAAAQANHIGVFFPPANYWLASQTASIAVSNVLLEGPGVNSYRASTVSVGAEILISNQSTSEFVVDANTTIKGLGFYWPAQDGSVSTPVAFPALFEIAPAEALGTVNILFEDLTITNAYSMFYVAATDNRWGDVFFRGVRAYCIQYCFDILNGAPDVMSVDPTSEFSSTIGGSISSAPGQYLPTFTSSQGEWMHVDTSGGGSYTHVDGNQLTNFLVHGYRYGIRLVNSPTQYDVDNLIGVQWDGVQTAFSVESGACMTGTISGGQVTSSPVATLPFSANADAISITSGCGTIGQIDFDGFGINSSLGHGITISGSNIVVNWTGGHISNWGQSNTTGINYGGMHFNSAAAEVNVTGASFVVTSGNLVTGYAIAGNSTGIVNVTGNFFRNLYSPGFFTSTSGVVTLSGNQSFQSSIVGPQNSMTSAAKWYDNPSNHWDKPPVPTATSGWGTSPTVDSKSTNNKFTITIGSGGATNPVLTFGVAGGSGVQASAPVCSAFDINAGTAWTMTASSNTAVTFSGSASASDVVQGTCSF